MRPAELWQFDYESENYTTLLWVVEGMTAYYDDHLCRRAGVLSLERYLEILADGIAALHRTPGRLLHPLATASFDAWIKLYRPDENTRNSTQSYYRNGSLAALCFDLTIRAKSGGQRSLDDALAELYRSTYERGRGYTTDDVVGCLGRAAGEDLAPLVRTLVDGPFDPDFTEFFEPMGLRLVEVPGESPYFGLVFRSGDLTIATVLTDGPAAEGGLSPDDEILALNGLRVTPATWVSILQNTWREGEVVRVLVSRRGRIVERSVTPVRAAIEKCRIERVPGANTERTRLRSSWLWEE
jgi:predicted metalloprotease with PDZ domain